MMVMLHFLRRFMMMMMMILFIF